MDVSAYGCRYFSCLWPFDSAHTINNMSATDRAQLPFEKAFAELCWLLHSQLTTMSYPAQTGQLAVTGIIPGDPNKSIYDVDAMIGGAMLDS